MCWRRAGCEGGLPASCLADRREPRKGLMGGKAMVGNMIRVLRARMTLLAVDEAGMSTVEYSTVSDYNGTRVAKQTDR